MRYAILRDGIVENITEWDGDTATWTPPDGTTAEKFPEGAISIGWLWNDGSPVDPLPAPEPEPAPERTPEEKLEAILGMTPAQLKAVLAAAGK